MRPHRATRALVTLLLLGLPRVSSGQVVVEAFLGSAYNVRTPLRISQDGQPPIRRLAAYRTRPFAGSPYYAWRVGFWERGAGWALEFVHHKLYLANRPPEVQRFEIPHGYNHLLVGRGWKRGRAVYVVAGGVVITHPETEVRALRRSGYFVSGPSLHVAAGRRVPLTARIFAAFEGRLSGSLAWFPVADGSATVANVAFHFHVGLGIGP